MSLGLLPPCVILKLAKAQRTVSLSTGELGDMAWESEGMMIRVSVIAHETALLQNNGPQSIAAAEA